jgi:hypothetical protein
LFFMGLSPVGGRLRPNDPLARKRAHSAMAEFNGYPKYPTTLGGWRPQSRAQSMYVLGQRGIPSVSKHQHD